MANVRFAGAGERTMRGHEEETTVDAFGARYNRYPASAVSDNVMLKNMVTNEKRVVILYVDGEYRAGNQLHYVLGCNQDETSCHVPDKGRYYHMESSEHTVYACPEVSLFEIDGTRKAVGVYCLNEMHWRSL